MLSPLLAHAGGPIAPHDLWGAWSLEPTVLAGLALALLAYRRGRARGPRRRQDRVRARCFFGGLAVLAVALVSPLDALSGTLASAHMVQHVLLLLVAAPLLAFSAPSSTLLRGSPAALRVAGPWRRRLGLGHGALRVLREPVPVWLLHVVAVWVWHAAVLYDAALASEPLHVLEHASFLVTGVLFWRVIVGARSGAGRVPAGLGVLLVFSMAMQSVLLSVLLTFARTPWYEGYATTTQVWGLEPLADQQLAGAIMWVPAGLVHLAVGLGLMAWWLREIERAAPSLGASASPSPAAPLPAPARSDT